MPSTYNPTRREMGVIHRGVYYRGSEEQQRRRPSRRRAVQLVSVEAGARPLLSLLWALGACVRPQFRHEKRPVVSELGVMAHLIGPRFPRALPNHQEVQTGRAFEHFCPNDASWPRFQTRTDVLHEIFSSHCSLRGRDPSLARILVGRRASVFLLDARS